MNADGGGQTNLTNSLGEDYAPDWSPDGTTISFSTDRVGNYEIFIMNADGSGKRILTDSRWEDSMPLYIPATFL